jgi:formylglycine-generating enzyme required for sulfatase activity
MANTTREKTSACWLLVVVAMIGPVITASCGNTAPTATSAVSSGSDGPEPSAMQAETKTRAADGMTLVYVPEGEFRMGRRGSSDARAHTVALDSFWIDETEVTNAHYGRCVSAGACAPPTRCSWGEPTYEDPGKADHPVVCVSWRDAGAYCAWAGGRLPTEASIYPWGDAFDGTRLNSCDASCPHEDQKITDYDDGHGRTAPVGSYPSGRGWCGALDMAGNVWEWVGDWHGRYPSARQRNPTGPESGSERLIRGGSWYDYNEYGFLRADNRHPFDPRAATDMIGFRCVVPAAREGDS